MRSFQPVRNGYAAVEVSQSIYFYPNVHVTTSRLSSLALLPIWGCVIKFGSETEGNCMHACACLLCVCVCVYMCGCESVCKLHVSACLLCVYASCACLCAVQLTCMGVCTYMCVPYMCKILTKQ